jgi:Zn finger protein HypA/HybF involved in hydrogenase expression
MRNRLFWLGGLALLAIIIIGLLSVSKAEEHDPFCISCHTAPEEVYFHRAQHVLIDGSSVDLASVHYQVSNGSFRCIDCHRGDHDLQDRATTLALGARDTLTLLTGRADPAIEKGHSTQPALQNTACTNCHTDTLTEPGFNNHFHNKLVAAGTETSTASSVTCTDCHRAHVQVVAGRDQIFLDIQNVVYPACVVCHTETGEGPLELMQ